MLDAVMLAEMQYQTEQLFGTTATISRNTVSNDGAGGITDSWATLASNVAASLQPASGAEREIANRIGAAIDAVVFLPDGQDVTARDRIAINNETYEVTAVMVRTGQEVVRKCFVVAKDVP